MLAHSAALAHLTVCLLHPLTAVLAVRKLLSWLHAHSACTHGNAQSNVLHLAGDDVCTSLTHFWLWYAPEKTRQP